MLHGLIHSYQRRLTKAIRTRFGKNYPYFLYFLPQYHIAYFEIPKAGCTTIKAQVFIPHLRPDTSLASLETSPQMVHDQLPATQYWFDVALKRRLRHHFIFTVVRDPVERFISFYNNKILHWHSLPEAEKHKDITASHFYFNEELEGLDNIDSLIEQLEYKHICHEPHVRPQTLLLPADLSIFDHIGNVKQMNHTLALLDDILGSTHKATPLNIYDPNQWGDKQYPQKQSSYDKLKQLYQDDYRLLEEYL
jgi:hypothetical protein